MRPSPARNLLLLALCLAVVQAQQEQDQVQQGQGQAQQGPQAVFDAPVAAASTNPAAGDAASDLPLMVQPSPEDLHQAKQGIREILKQVPIQRVEPLFDSMTGYCKAFHALCTFACEERESPEAAQEETVIANCVDTKATSLAQAGALCQCAGLELTDRINFAIIGGVVTSKSAEPVTDFGAEGLLDGLTFLPGVPVFLSVLHVLQNVCGFVSILASPGVNTPAPSTGGSFWSNIPIIGGLFGGSKPSPTPSTPGASPSPTSKGWFPIFGNLFGGGAKPTPTPAPSTPSGTTAPKVSGTAAASGPNPTPTTAPKKGGGLFGWFSEVDEDGQMIEDQDASQGPDQVNRQEVNRLVSRDGRVARIVRAQKRQAERLQEQQDKVDL